MSLRKDAEILGVNAGHLSRMINGKRAWNPEIKARYESLVGNTFGNTSQSGNTPNLDNHSHNTAHNIVNSVPKNVYNDNLSIMWGCSSSGRALQWH